MISKKQLKIQMKNSIKESKKKDILVYNQKIIKSNRRLFYIRVICEQIKKLGNYIKRKY